MNIKTIYALFSLGICIFMFGMLFNYIVIVENGCKMPVNLNYHYETQTHISYKNIAENGLKLEYEHFADRFEIDIPFRNTTLYYSIGDLLMFIGGIIFIFAHSIICYKIYIKKYIL